MNIRASAKILFHEAEKLGLEPKWETPYGLFSVQLNNKQEFIFYTRSYLNTQLGAWFSTDKYTTNIILERNKVKVIPYLYAAQIPKVNAFFDKHHPLIAKPLEGRESIHVKLIAERQALKRIPIREMLFEKYITGVEYRYLMLKKEVVAVQRKELKPSLTNPWKKYIINLEKKEWNNNLVEQSIQIANILHLGFVAIDFIVDEQNNTWFLETNSAPSLHYFHNPDRGKPVNLARKLLKETLSTKF